MGPRVSAAGPAAVVLSTSEDETFALAARLGSRLRAGDVIALHGELGAGKTGFVRGLARGMGCDPSQVSSPTFVILNLYDGPRLRLAHADAYRLSGPEELADLGWDRLIDGRTVLAVEWAERIEAELPPHGSASRWDVRLEHVGETTRRITIEAPKTRDRAPGERHCRTCGNAMSAHAPDGPFCSERCRLADLGKWFTGAYRISRPIEQRDLEEG